MPAHSGHCSCPVEELLPEASWSLAAGPLPDFRKTPHQEDERRVPCSMQTHFCVCLMLIHMEIFTAQSSLILILSFFKNMNYKMRLDTTVTNNFPFNDPTAVWFSFLEEYGISNMPWTLAPNCWTHKWANLFNYFLQLLFFIIYNTNSHWSLSSVSSASCHGISVF